MNKALKTALQVIGIVAIITAVILFVRSNSSKSIVGTTGERATSLTGSASIFSSTATPAPTATPEPTLEETLQVDEAALEDYLDQIVWDDEFQKFVDSDTEQHDDPYYYQKLWLSFHPEYEIPGIGNIYYESSPGSAAEATPAPGEYVNKVIEYTYDGGTITIGADAPGRVEGIRLDMSCSQASDIGRVGFYLTSENNMLLTDFGPGDVKPADAWPGCLNFYIPARYYDSLVPATPTETLFGAVWLDDRASIGIRTESDSIYVRAVNVDSGYLLTTFRIDIAFVDGKYQITDVTDTEVLSTAALSEAERSTIVQDALDFLIEAGRGPAISINDPDRVRDSAIVEYVPCTYFSSLYDADQDPAIRSSYAGVDTYAVNMNVPGMGVITLYYGPFTQVMYHFESATEPDSTEKNLTLFGFDATAPFSEESIMVINGFLP